MTVALGLMLASLPALVPRASAQPGSSPATTTVAETVYRADGTAAAGSLLISWPAFSTFAGASVPAGSTTVSIGAGGALSVSLVANAGSTPMGSYYTVVYQLSDGSVTREYWVVPVSSSPVQVSAIRSTVLPATVAMQTVSKSYVDTAIAAAVAAVPRSPASAFTALDTVYDFTDQAGTAVADRIGANTGTLGGTTPPVWTGTGIAFGPGANIALPSALNGERTFYFSIYIDPITAGTQAFNQFPALMSSTTGGTGFNVMLESPGSVGAGLSDYTYSPTLYPNTVSTSSPYALSGFGVLTVVCGTGSGSVDRFYWNGNELSYTAQGSNCGAQTGGNLVLGSSGVSPWASAFFPGTFYGFGASSQQHTPAQVQQNVSAFIALATEKGVPIAPIPVAQATPQLLAAGDSITAGTAGQTPYTSQLTLTNQPAYTVTNYGIVGVRLAAILSHEPNRAALRCSSQGGPSIALLEGGTNDLYQTNPLSPQQVWTSAAAWAALMRRAGCVPFMLTMISRISTGYDGQTMDALKDSYDALIVQQARAVGFAGVLDVAANPLLGADGAYNNATYFQAVDHIHPTTAGNALMAAAVSNGLNWYFGYNDGNPHVVAALSSFTMACSDGAIELSGLTAGGNIALPDCTGASGATFRIDNPQTAYAVTVTADSPSHPVNGSSSAVTVPAGGSLVLHLVPNPKTAAGWHWEY
jgi:lysophospholipase L1-like esterase